MVSVYLVTITGNRDHFPLSLSIYSAKYKSLLILFITEEKGKHTHTVIIHKLHKRERERERDCYKVIQVSNSKIKTSSTHSHEVT